MAATYIPIASTTLTTSAASVTFSAIPNTYTDLVLRYSARTGGTGTGAQLSSTFNSVTSGYSTTALRGNSSAAASLRNSSANGFPNYDAVNDGGTTSNTFASGEIYIPSYLVSQNKPISISAVIENNDSAAASAFIWGFASLWSNTAAISSFTLSTNGTNGFQSGSSFFLYGIKNS